MRGTCACGAVAVDAAQVAPIGVHCHCTTCTKVAGGGGATSVLVPRQALAIHCRDGALASYRSSPNSQRWHCAACHAPIYTDVEDLPELGFFVSATLFDPTALAGVRFEHMFVRSAPAWQALGDDAPLHQADAPGATLGLPAEPRRAPAPPPRFVRPER